MPLSSLSAVVALLAVASLPLPLAPAAVRLALAATPQDGVIVADGVVHAGIYPEATGPHPEPPFDPAIIEQIGIWGGKPTTFVGFFHSLTENVEFTLQDMTTISMLNAAWGAGATPFSNVNFQWPAGHIVHGITGPLGVNHEQSIRTWAGHITRWLQGENPPGDSTTPTEDRSLVIAPFQEMNGDWTAYGCYRTVSGSLVTEAAHYREAFRRFVTIFREELPADLLARVRWAFAPNGWTSPGCGAIADYYPGDSYVDVIGISAFNPGTLTGSWRTPRQAMQGHLDEIRTTVNRFKPFLIAQTASSGVGGDKDQWIRDLFEFAQTDSNVVALVWFNLNVIEEDPSLQFDWKCCPDLYPGWQDAMQHPSTLYEWPLTDWFQPGPLPFEIINRAPEVADDALTVDENRATVISVLSNDRDPNGDPMTVTVISQPRSGAAVENPDGTVTYRHQGPGQTDSFAYIAGDGELHSTPATVSITAKPVVHSVGLVDVGQGLWHLRNEAGAVTSFFYGNPNDIPFVGDWDCDGIDGPGLYRQSDGFVYLRNSSSQGIADIRFFFGNPSDFPLAGDFNGDGCDTLSLYRPSTQEFFIVNKLGENEGGLGAADFSFTFGNRGDKPVVSDWDGDRIDEVGLHREATGFFYWRNTLTTGIADGEIFFGDPGDRFVAGDWGIVDGKDTPAVFRPIGTTFFFRHSNTQGVADSQFVFGASTWLPVAGEFGLG